MNRVYIVATTSLMGQTPIWGVWLEDGGRGRRGSGVSLPRAIFRGICSNGGRSNRSCHMTPPKVVSIPLQSGSSGLVCKQVIYVCG